MKYDVLIIDKDILSAEFSLRTNCIRFEPMTLKRAKHIYDIFSKQDVTVCFVPHKE